MTAREEPDDIICLQMFAHMVCKQREKVEDAFLRVFTRAEFENQKFRFCCIKENFEYRRYWDRHRKDLLQGNLDGLKRFGFEPTPDDLSKHLVALLDPKAEISYLPLEEQGLLLRIICDLSDADRGIRRGDIRISQNILSSTVFLESSVGRNDMVLLVDMSKSEAQLVKEFKWYLKCSRPSPRRFREEAWQHLAVWKARRERKSFRTIAQEMKITEAAAKQSFYRAYKLTQGISYDPETCKRELWEAKAATIRKTCQNCPDHPQKGGNCKTLCPDMLFLANRDRKASRETLVRTKQGAAKLHGLKDDKDD